MFFIRVGTSSSDRLSGAQMGSRRQTSDRDIVFTAVGTMGFFV